ncbi:hypothetical protein GGQ81_000264 [Sphingomonas desiccabilis]|nr:hypothetical protein [Sphingomonas desiccabilis]
MLSARLRGSSRLDRGNVRHIIAADVQDGPHTTI